MEHFLVSFTTFFVNLPVDNPAYIDILKMLGGTTIWIGGLAGYMRWREKNLKVAVDK